MRSAIIFLAIVAYVYGETLNLFLYEELPELYKEFIPEHVRKFFTTLSIEEKILIREFAAKTGDFSKKSDDEIWELLKTKNLDLYKKAFEVRTLVEKKIDNLKPEAKTFIEFLFERLRLVYKNSDKQHLQETAKQIIGKFKDLKEDYRLDVKTHFIRIYEYIQDSKFEELAKGIFRFIDGEILNLFLYEELPELYKEFIPEKVRKFFITLSVEEKTLIREFATKTGDFSKKSDDEVWELLKTKNLELYKKVFEVRTFVEQKTEDLKPETKTFVELLFERLRLVYKNSDIQYLQETAKQIIGKFKDLKEDYRLDLKTHFLRIYEYIQDSKFEELANGAFQFVDEFIPEHVRKFFTTLSIEEKTLIREFAIKTDDFSKKSDDEVWELLKTKNLELYKKVFEVRTFVEKKIEDLKPETKTFVELLFERLRLVYKNSDKQHLQETAKQIIGKFKDLKEDYRLDLKSHFLRIYEYIQDSKFEELANGIRFE
uniref:Fatty-acid and retinol-binding protein 1 n=1 Tax=Acrobeloides nanus TaxID=290746 RepID=A0A914BW51_9BILA